MPPGRSLAGEQPLPQQRLEDPEGGAGSALGVRLIDQNMADCFRSVEQNRGAAEEAADDNLLLISPLRPDPEMLVRISDAR
jgi:hypothetical protein